MHSVFLSSATAICNAMLRLTQYGARATSFRQVKSLTSVWQPQSRLVSPSPSAGDQKLSAVLGYRFATDLQAALHSSSSISRAHAISSLGSSRVSSVTVRAFGAEPAAATSETGVPSIPQAMLVVRWMCYFQARVHGPQGANSTHAGAQ